MNMEGKGDEPDRDNHGCREAPSPAAWVLPNCWRCGATPGGDWSRLHTELRCGHCSNMRTGVFTPGPTPAGPFLHCSHNAIQMRNIARELQWRAQTSHQKLRENACISCLCSLPKVEPTGLRRDAGLPLSPRLSHPLVHHRAGPTEAKADPPSAAPGASQRRSAALLLPAATTTNWDSTHGSTCGGNRRGMSKQAASPPTPTSGEPRGLLVTCGHMRAGPWSTDHWDMTAQENSLPRFPQAKTLPKSDFFF